MTVHEIVFFPEDILLQEAEKVVLFDESLHNFLDSMAETMYSANGVGLAAPQVGRGIQATVIDLGEDRGEGIIELINPQITFFSKKMKTEEEGCLSFPGLYAPVERPDEITVSALDRYGKPFEISADGILSVVLQHEIDHLFGRLFIDKISRIRRTLIVQKMKKINKQRVRKK